MATKRLLVQQPGKGDRWQALQVFDDTGGGARYELQDLDTPQATRWQQEGGFEIVPGERFNAELQQASATDRAQRARRGLADAGWLGDSERGGVTDVTMRPASGDAFDVEAIYQSGAKQRAGLDRARASALQGLMGANILPAPFKGLTMAQEDEAARDVAAFQQSLKKPFRGLDPAEAADAERKVASFQAGLQTKATDSATASRPVARRGMQVARAGATGLSPRLAEAMRRAPPGEPDAMVSNSPAPASGDAEFTAAQDEADRRALMLGLSRAAQNINTGLTGVQSDREAFNALAGQTDSPVRRLLAQRKADEAKRLGDPTSEESKRFQAAVAKALPGVYTPEELALVTAGDRDSIMRAGEMRQKLEQRKADILRAQQETTDERAFAEKQAGAQRTFQAGESAKQRAFQREMQGQENAAALERARVAAQQKGAPGTVPGTVIPGLEIVPGAAPTAQDATTVKKSLEAKERLRGSLDELRALHTSKGTEFVGPQAERMRQLVTAVQLEAKTLADLGAITGPDYDLIKSLSGSDPTSLGANVKAFFTGGYWDNTKQALDGIEKWAADKASAAQRVYGYQPAGGAAPTASAPQASAAPQRTVKDGKTYEYENGQWYEVL